MKTQRIYPLALLASALSTFPLGAQSPIPAAEIDCFQNPLQATLQSDATSQLRLAAPTLAPASYFVRSQPSNLVVNGDFETTSAGWLAQPPFDASLIGPNAIGGQYTPTMTNVTTVPNWTVTGGNATSYIWHGKNSALLGSAPSAGGTGYIYMGIGAQNWLAGGVAYYAPFSASPEGRITPPGAVALDANNFTNFTGRSPSVPHPTGPVAIEQSVSLTPGQNYRMTFYVVGEATRTRANYTTIDGLIGLDISGYAREHLVVGGYDSPFSGQNGRYYTLEFTAKQAATTIRFLNFGHATISANSTTITAEGAIDDVIINACSAPKQVPQVPVANSFSLLATLFASLALLAGLTLRRQYQSRTST
jgi:hypothetical protein